MDTPVFYQVCWDREVDPRPELPLGLVREALPPDPAKGRVDEEIGEAE